MTFYDDKAATINALQGAVLAIENELGITPAGIYASVRTRLDILESRINNPFSPSPQVNNPFFIGNTGVTISTGLGFPTENRIPGSLYLREDGYNIQGLYSRRLDGYWHQIDTDPFTAAGDLSGTIYSQTVIGLQNHAINPNALLLQTDAAGDGYILTWNATANAGAGWWEPQIGFFAYGDLSGTKINQIVSNLQGTKLTIGTMTSARDGYVLTWNNGSTQWEPQRSAVVFDALDNSTTTNIRSNRYITQSPIDNTKSGIVNLGSRSTGSTTGVTANYSSILGGDQHQVAATYSSVIGGQSNVINSSGVQGVIGGGSSNTISGIQSAILGGASNQTTGSQNYIVGGLFNATSGTQSFIGAGNANSITSGNYGTIINGQLNTVSGSFSSVLNGVGHSITADRSMILNGLSNKVDLNGTFASVLGGASNTVHSRTDGYTMIITGSSNVIQSSSQYSTIVNGSSHNIGGSLSNTILNGTSNNLGANYGVILNGSSNSITGNNSVVGNGSTNAISGAGSFVIGDNNTINSDKSIVQGDNNIIYSSSGYSNIWGSSNSIGQTSTSPYSTIYGSGNTSLGPYNALYGSTNVATAGTSYVDVHGQQNTINGSPYVSIWGYYNQVDANANYAAVFGGYNSILNGAAYSFTSGYQNTVGGQYNGAWGSNNTINAVSSGYSQVWGSYNNVTGDWSTAYGYYNNINSSGAFVHGEFAKATQFGQYSHAARSFSSNAGTEQFTRLLVSGSANSGGSFTLTLDGSNNISTENGKCYDMSVRILVNATSGSPVCARYVFNVLAHTESGTLTIDNVSAVSIDDNGTGWVGGNWVNIIGASSNNLTITIPNSGVQNRRAFATVEWRELTRF